MVCMFIAGFLSGYNPSAQENAERVEAIDNSIYYMQMDRLYELPWFTDVSNYSDTQIEMTCFWYVDNRYQNRCIHDIHNTSSSLSPFSIGGKDK